LVAANPGHTAYRQELARTLYNRGIVRASGTTDTEFRAAEKDFRDAIELLAPLAAQDAGGMPAQELARAYNNLAVHIAADATRLGDAADLYDRAIDLDERLLAAEPDNQQYSLELAQFTNNSADVLRKLTRFAQARERNQRVLGLLSEPPRPPPLLAIELADTHQLRGRILEAENDRSTGIVPAYEESLRRFQAAARDPAALGLQHFHLRFGDLLLSIADRARSNVDADRARRLLMHAVDWYVALANSGPSGPPRYADTILDNLSLMVTEFGEAEQRVILKRYPQLQNRSTRPK
jgi:tetratricopeptide (TPR) repeat protein